MRNLPQNLRFLLEKRVRFRGGRPIAHLGARLKRRATTSQEEDKLEPAAVSVAVAAHPLKWHCRT